MSCVKYEKDRRQAGILVCICRNTEIKHKDMEKRVSLINPFIQTILRFQPAQFISVVFQNSKTFFDPNSVREKIHTGLVILH